MIADTATPTPAKRSSAKRSTAKRSTATTKASTAKRSSAKRSSAKARSATPPRSALSILSAKPILSPPPSKRSSAASAMPDLERNAPTTTPANSAKASKGSDCTYKAGVAKRTKASTVVVPTSAAFKSGSKRCAITRTQGKTKGSTMQSARTAAVTPVVQGQYHAAAVAKAQGHTALSYALHHSTPKASAACTYNIEHDGRVIHVTSDHHALVVMVLNNLTIRPVVSVIKRA